VSSSPAPSDRDEDVVARSNRLLAFGGLLVRCSPGVLLGWGFSVGMVAGCAISYGLWWVNRG